MAGIKKDEEPKKPRRRVKKVKGHGGHHGGSWKVAYADFVTAMMALFLVLWLVSQADTKLKQAIANYFRSPGVFSTMQGGILSQAKKVSKEPTNLTSKDDEQALFSVAQNLRKQFSTRPEFTKSKDQVTIDVTEEGLRIQVIDKADRISFPSGSAELTPEARTVLAEIADDICSLPNKINIGGHTDSYVFGNDKGYTNWELSTDRANAARRILEAACVKPEQIHRIVGFADTDPLVPEDPYSPANRRISITVLRLNQLPDKDDSSGENSASPGKTSGNSGKQPGQKPAAPASKSVSETAPKSTAASPEDQTTKAKLLKEGAVTVGAPDEVPPMPAVKEPEKTSP